MLSFLPDSAVVASLAGLAIAVVIGWTITGTFLAVTWIAEKLLLPRRR